MCQKKKKIKVLSTDMGNIGIEVKMKIQKMGEVPNWNLKKARLPSNGFWQKLKMQVGSMCLHLRAWCDFDWSYNNQKLLGFDNWIWRSEIKRTSYLVKQKNLKCRF